MALRTRLSLTWLEARDTPDGGFDPPSSAPQYTPPVGDLGTGSGINPGQGPIGGGETWVAPPPPGNP